MKTGRTNQKWQKPLAFLAEAPLGWLVARGQIRQFAADCTVDLGDLPGEWAFLLLSGSCRLRRNLPGEAGDSVLHTFRRGETFGSFLPPETNIIAAKDSAVFCVPLRDLVNRAPKVNGNGHGHSPFSEIPDAGPLSFPHIAPTGTITTLAFFSATLPEKCLAENIARRVYSETGASVMLVLMGCVL